MSRGDHIAKSGLGRMYRGQTAIDFYGHRRIGLVAAIVILLVTVGSLATRGLNLGLDFVGGQAWDVPATNGFDIDAANDVLADNDVPTAGAKVQRRSPQGADNDIIRIQIEEVPDATARALSADFAAAAGVDAGEVSFEFTSSSWGRDITEKAVRALVIFLIIASLFITLRFEWRMAMAALAAMAHDVLLTVGVYSVFQFEVTPATVIAFLTILGYSLYDTIVVFDRIKENEGRFASVRMPYADIVNISMNQVLMRSINTSISSILPVLSLLFIGSGLLGATTLSEFALALLIGMLSGVYSSIFVAAPLLATVKSHGARKSRRERLVGEDLRAAVVGAGVSGRVLQQEDDGDGDRSDDEGRTAAVHRPAEHLLTHPPRPRKKKRR